VNDVLGEPLVLVLAPDSASFFAFERPDANSGSRSSRIVSSPRVGATTWPAAATQARWRRCSPLKSSGTAGERFTRGPEPT